MPKRGLQKPTVVMFSAAYAAFLSGDENGVSGIHVTWDLNKVHLSYVGHQGKKVPRIEVPASDDFLTSFAEAILSVRNDIRAKRGGTP